MISPVSKICNLTVYTGIYPQASIPDHGFPYFLPSPRAIHCLGNQGNHTGILRLCSYLNKQKRMEYSSSDKSEKGDEVSSQPSTSDDDGSVAPILPLPEKLASLSPEELQRLAKWATFKMDVALMPMLVIMSVLNFLDRQNLASARLAGLEEDLNLNEVQYQTAVSILFVGYSKCSPKCPP